MYDSIVKTCVLFIVSLCFIASPSAHGKVIYVDDDGPADFDTIQAAINVASAGDTVLVASGTYTGNGNRNIGIGKSITIRSEHGPRTCIIDCQSEQEFGVAAIAFSGSHEVTSVLDGFTITNAPFGGIRTGIHPKVHIRNCIISGNSGGIHAMCPDIIVENCVIAGNVARNTMNQLGESSLGYGGGILYHGSGLAVVRNCRISGNRAGFGGGIASAGIVHLENSILIDNRASSGHGHQAYLGLAGATCTAAGCPSLELLLSHCCIENDDPNDFYDEAAVWPRSVLRLSNCMMANPEIAEPGYWDPNGTPDDLDDDLWVDGDYHLKSQAGRWDPVSQSWVMDDVTSACIDAGDPNSPIGLESFPNGGRINIGAYGGTAEASKSYFGEPVCETVIAGDINGDCRVDFRDLQIMARHWLEERND